MFAVCLPLTALEQALFVSRDHEMVFERDFQLQQTLVHLSDKSRQERLPDPHGPENGEMLQVSEILQNRIRDIAAMVRAQEGLFVQGKPFDLRLSYQWCFLQEEVKVDCLIEEYCVDSKIYVEIFAEYFGV
jgi:hypothetical protein